MYLQILYTQWIPWYFNFLSHTYCMTTQVVVHCRTTVHLCRHHLWFFSHLIVNWLVIDRRIFIQHAKENTQATLNTRASRGLCMSDDIITLSRHFCFHSVVYVTYYPHTEDKPLYASCGFMSDVNWLQLVIEIRQGDYSNCGIWTVPTATAAFHSEPNMRSDADIQHLWWQSVRSCRPWTMEQSSIAPERCWHIVQWIPPVAKDISVWTVGPRRFVNCINCAD